MIETMAKEEFIITIGLLAVVLLAAILVIPCAKRESSSGITREEAWRAFFASYRAVLKILFAVSVSAALIWILFVISFEEGETPLSVAVEIVQSGGSVFYVVFGLVLLFIIMIINIQIIGVFVCATVIREFAFMHGIAQTRWYTFTGFTIDEWAKHPFFRGWFHALYYCMFSWRSVLVTGALFIIFAVLFLGSAVF